ncbi:MAG: hypothetical protein FWC56_02455 [Phycisphaerae bacterium]|nr:hypothetical protein [Phycisphaerae bacterium]
MNRWIARHLVWPITERMLSRDTLHRYRSLRKTDLAPASVLADIQMRKLRRIFSAVNAHCSFYHERFHSAGIDATDPQLGLDALKKLPLLNRSDIRENLDAMTWHDCPGGPAQPYTTGGSSGEPLQFYFDRGRQATDWATRLRHRSWWNLSPGDRELMIWAGPVRRSTCDRLRIWRDRLLNQQMLDAFNMSEATLRDYANRIRRDRPQLLYGYASSLALLARHLLKRGDVLTSHSLIDDMVAGNESTDDASREPHKLREFRELRAVFVTGETVTPQDAADIRSAFGAPVVIEYGARDGGLIACACPAGRLHVADENIIVEVLDENGQPVQPGGVGEVVITNLEAFATPMIRYRIGDIARVGDNWHNDAEDRRCPCGRASSQLLEVHGRTTDQIVRMDGQQVRRMHALSLIYVLREMECLKQFRIVQQEVQKLIVEVVADERFTPTHEQNMLRSLQERMGPDVNITVARCQQITPTKSGKHACVISHVKMAE